MYHGTRTRFYAFSFSRLVLRLFHVTIILLTVLPNTKTHKNNLPALGRTHRLLLQEFNCVESAPDPPADPAAGDDADERDSDGPHPAAPLPLPPLNTLAPQHASEDEGTKLPEQRCVPAQIMRNWEQHTAIAGKPPSSRCAEMHRLHRTQPFDAITCTEEGDAGHSILQKDMPDDEDYHCCPSREESFAIQRRRGSRAITSIAHGQCRNASLHGSRWRLCFPLENTFGEDMECTRQAQWYPWMLKHGTARNAPLRPM